VLGGEDDHGACFAYDAFVQKAVAVSGGDAAPKAVLAEAAAAAERRKSAF